MLVAFAGPARVDHPSRLQLRFPRCELFEGQSGHVSPPDATALFRAHLPFAVVAAVPTAATGLADWSELHKPHQRVGVVHAVANVTGLSCYLASLSARMHGKTCFNFQRADADIMAELREVTDASVAGLRHAGYVQGA